MSPPVAFVNATVTWPSADVEEESDGSSPRLGTMTPGGRTPGHRKFIMPDLSVDFPVGELTLVCGPLGSGKTLLLLGMPTATMRRGSITDARCSTAWGGGPPVRPDCLPTITHQYYSYFGRAAKNTRGRMDHPCLRLRAAERLASERLDPRQVSLVISVSRSSC
jgi:hypothetical protein